MKPAPSVVTLTDVDLNSVDALRKRNIGTLGFLVRGALSDHLASGGGLGLKSQDNRLVAYPVPLASSSTQRWMMRM